MTTAPSGLSYTTQHTWVSTQTPAQIGITDFAQKNLGEAIYLELPKVGDEVIAGHIFGELESTKAVSELYAPISGRVVDVNQAVIDDPSLVNRDPYGKGWLITVQAHGTSANLISAQDYTALTATQ